MAKAKKSKIKVDPAEAKERVLKILPILKKTYPGAKIALNWDSMEQERINIDQVKSYLREKLDL